MKRDKNKKETEKPKKGGGFKVRYALYLAVTLLIILSLVSYSATDNSILDGGSEGLIKNWIGYAGAYFSRYCFYFFGIAAFPIVGLLVVCALRPFLNQYRRRLLSPSEPLVLLDWMIAKLPSSR